MCLLRLAGNHPLSLNLDLYYQQYKRLWEVFSQKRMIWLVKNSPQEKLKNIDCSSFLPFFCTRPHLYVLTIRQIYIKLFIFPLNKKQNTSFQPINLCQTFTQK